MSKKNDCWGIEVGANAIKAMRLVRSGGQVNVADYAVVPFKRILTTPDLNVEEQIQLGLDQFLSAHDLSKSTVVVSVAGNMAFARFAKLPPVEPKKIPEIVKFEAAQQIPFPIEQVEWDYHVFTQPDSPDVEVGIFAMTRDKITDFLDPYERAEITLDAVTLSPLAVYNAVAHDLELTGESRGVVMLDVGTTSTDVVIFDEGKLWMRTLNTGGNNFTEALVRAFKLSFPKAEKLKREASTSKYARQIFTAMRPVFADLVQEVQRSLGYYQSLNREVRLEKLIGFGSTFRLPGLQKYFKQQIQMEVTRPDGFKRLSIDGKRASDFSDQTINLATAYGLALQGLGLGQIDANVLPAQQIRQRMWRVKQPWFAASAAMVALPAVMLWGSILTTGHQRAQAEKQTKQHVRSVLNEAKQYNTDYSEITKKNDPRPKIEGLSRILDYRDVWPKLMQDLNDAVASLNSQPETIVPDYKENAKIERRDRMRVYIKRIDVKYSYDLPDPTPSTTSYPSYLSSSYPKKTQKSSVTRFDTGTPTFEITVEGTTPMRNGVQLLDQYVIKWFQDHNDQPNRPYRIEVADDALSWRKIRSSAAADREGDSPPQLIRRGRRSRLPATARTKSAPKGGAVLLKELLPRRPLGDESREEDGNFEITWTVKLTEPLEARKAETGTRIQKAKEKEADDVHTEETTEQSR